MRAGEQAAQAGSAARGGTMTSLDEKTLEVDGRSYRVRLHRPVRQPAAAPRLVVVSYLPTAQAADILRVCIRGIRQFTPEAHELWVVDNNSPPEHAQWLLGETAVNVIFNLTEPAPPGANRLPARIGRWLRRLPPTHGSYANGIALELGARLIDADSALLMPLHMDTLPCRRGWLSFLRRQLNGTVRAAGVRLDTGRVPAGVLHVLGYLVDFQLFRQLGLSFLPQLPAYDVGDKVTVALRAHGYDVFACRNTLWEPALAQRIPRGSPLRDLPVDRAFDAEGNVIFLHLGRGVRKAHVAAGTRGLTAADWLEFATDWLQNDGPGEAHEIIG